MWLQTSSDAKPEASYHNVHKKFFAILLFVCVAFNNILVILYGRSSHYAVTHVRNENCTQSSEITYVEINSFFFFFFF